MRPVLKNREKNRDKNLFARSESGFTLAEILIATAILGIVGTAFFSVIDGVQAVKRYNDGVSIIATYRSNIVSTLRSPDLFSKMGDINGIPCFKTLQSCGGSGTAYTKFSTVNRNGLYLTNSVADNAGFSMSGAACTTFPSHACPLRYETEWKALCQGAACTTPQFKVRGTLKTFENERPSVNTGLYGFEITIGQVIGTYEQSCTSIGGTYVPGNPPRCQLSMGGDCPPGQLVVGYDRASNTKICKRTFEWFSTEPRCANGQVMMGTDANGAPVCMNARVDIRNTPTCIANPSDPSCMILFDCQADPTQPACGTFGAMSDGGAGWSGGGDGGDGGCGGGGDGGGGC